LMLKMGDEIIGGILYRKNCGVGKYFNILM
jgi:hypothetical protein